MSHSEMDFSSWTLDNFYDYIHERLEKPIEVVDLRYARQLKVWFLRVDYENPEQLAKIAQHVVGDKYNIKAIATKDPTLWVFSFIPTKNYQELRKVEYFVLIRKEVLEENIWAFFTFDKPEYIRKTLRRILRLTGINSIWIPPEDLKRLSRDLGYISGFTASFTPYNPKYEYEDMMMIGGIGRRTIKLWGHRAEKELELVQNELRARVKRVGILYGSSNPGFTPIAAVDDCMIYITAGEPETYAKFLNTLNHFENWIKENQLAQRKIVLPTEEVQKVIFNDQQLVFRYFKPGRGLVLKIEAFNKEVFPFEEFKPAFVGFFTKSKHFSGRILYEDEILTKVDTFDLKKYVRLMISLYKENGQYYVQITAPFGGSPAALEEAARNVIFRLSPLSDLEK